MQSWDHVREKIKSINLVSNTSLSDFRSLNTIIDNVEKLNIDPANASQATISNLRTIIKPTKDAIAAHSKTDINKLFELAATFSNRDLRYHLGEKNRVFITFSHVMNQSDHFYQLNLSKEQFDIVQALTKSKFNYQEESK